MILLIAAILLPGVSVTAEEGSGTLPENAQKIEKTYSLAMEAISSEDYAKAKEYLHICFAYCDPQSSPDLYADLLLKQAYIDVTEENYDIALLALDAAAELQPDLANVYLARTRAYSAQDHLTEAAENLEKYIELTGDASLYETAAQLYEGGGDTEAAQKAYDKYAESAGADNRETGFQAGRYRMGNGKYDEAIELFQAYTDDEQYAAGAQYNIGWCRMQQGDYEAAAAAFTACEEAGGTFTGLYYNRGICRMMSRDWENGAVDFARSIESEPYADDARYNLGICRMELGEYKDAAAAFDELINSAGDKDDASLDDSVFYFRAVSNTELGNLEEAIRDLTVCIDHGYEPEQSYKQRAAVYAAMGDNDNQARDLENAREYADSLR